MSAIERYPLSWPGGWKRTAPSSQSRAKFGKSSSGSYSDNNWTPGRRLTVSDSLGRITDELRRMGIGDYDVIISTNMPLRLDGLPRSGAREPADPGAAIYWEDSSDKWQCMAIDRYDRVADNLAAIAATLEHMRAIERHGGAEILNRAFAGFAALPPGPGGKSWREVLKFENGYKPTPADVKDRFIALAKSAHPDKIGGSDSDMAELNAARDAALKELKA